MRISKFASRGICGGAIAAAVLAPSVAFAQAAPPPAAPPPAAAAPAPAPAPAPVEAAPAPVEAAPPPATGPMPVVEAQAAPAAAEPVTAPPPPDVPPPPPEEEKFPPIQVGAWLRAGMQISSGVPDGKLNDHQFDTVYAELHTSGKLHKMVSWVLNLNANGQGGRNLDRNQQQAAGIEDAIIGLDLADEFHVWVGQLLTPVDRTNGSGPFFTIPWTYTGVIGGNYVGPAGEDVYGRSTGAVVWGDIGGMGKFKYFLSSMNMRSIENRPLFSGRLVGTFIGSEKGFWGNSTWDGAQDVLAVSVGGQFQKDGSVAPGALDPTDLQGRIDVLEGKATVPPSAVDDFKEINADVVAEFGMGGGYLTAEAGIYAFAGDYRLYDNMFYGLLAFATPAMGPGRLQPMFRYQHATATSSPTPDLSKIDLQLNYLVKGAALRGILGYSTTDVGADKNINAVQFAAQTIF